MIDVTLTVNKAQVYDEVAKTTSYTGTKMQGDESAYDRIFTTDDDRMMLERFWVEACNAATEQFKHFLVSVNAQDEGQRVDLENNYEVQLELSSSYDTNLTGSMQTSLFSFFVSFIVSKWYKFTNKGEADSYGQDAAAMMDDVVRKMYYKKKPVRVVPS